MNKNSAPVIHPFMVASLFVLVCYREVQPFVKWQELLGCWLGALAVTWLLFRLIGRFEKEQYKAALLTTLFIGTFCFAGDFTGFCKRSFGEGFGKYYLLVYLGGMGLLGFLLVRTRRNLLGLKKFLNVFISAMAVATMVHNHLVPVHFISRRDRQREVDEHGPFAQTNSRPDIYYLVFDSYTSPESLKQYWSYDDSALVTFLASNGFHVVANARANFDQTPRCMAASMNMRLPAGPPADLSSFGRVNRLFEIVDLSAVPRKLEDIGYRIVNLSPFDVAGRERVYGYPQLEYSEITDVMVEKSLAGFARRYVGHMKVRSANEAVLNQLREVIKDNTKQPRFVYSHLMLPHHPFFYDRNGVKPHPRIHGSANDYLEQLIYANGVITNVIAAILTHSAKPPIIVLQGDHGYRFLNNEHAGEEGLTILNAYHLPGEQPGWVHQGITPVNSFRMIFNHYFGARYGYWPDTSQVFAEQITSAPKP